MAYWLLQALRLKEIERRLMEDTRRKKHDWERDVEKMREEFLTLYPCDEVYHIPPSSSYATDSDESAKRRGSTDVLDSRQMKTMFLEYPDAGNAFLPPERNALRRLLLWRRGCVSVTLMYCAQTTEPIIVRPSPDCSPAILVFPYRA